MYLIAGMSMPLYKYMCVYYAYPLKCVSVSMIPFGKNCQKCWLFVQKTVNFSKSGVFCFHCQVLNSVKTIQAVDSFIELNTNNQLVTLSYLQNTHKTNVHFMKSRQLMVLFPEYSCKPYFKWISCRHQSNSLLDWGIIKSNFTGDTGTNKRTTVIWFI